MYHLTSTMQLRNASLIVFIMIILYTYVVLLSSNVFVLPLFLFLLCIVYVVTSPRKNGYSYIADCAEF